MVGEVTAGELNSSMGDKGHEASWWSSPLSFKAIRSILKAFPFRRLLGGGVKTLEGLPEFDVEPVEGVEVV